MIEDRTHTGFRDLIIGVDRKIPLPNGSMVTPINFDNAATTPPLETVITAINEFSPWYSSIHRGTGYKSALTTDFYDSSRKTVADFIHADLSRNIVIYTKNATEAINKLAHVLYANNSRQIILTTEMEHHSNILPWKAKFKTDYIKVDKNGRLSIGDLVNKLILYKGKVGLVAVSGASNVTGYINPIYEIASICHKYNARILVDGAQMIPHCNIDMLPTSNSSHIDFLTFSAHKLYAPFGIGVLVGPKKDFENASPDYSGGGTVKYVTKDKVIWSDPPEKEEAGTPNVMGVVALIAAIRTMSAIGMNKIGLYELKLFEYAVNKLYTIPDLVIYNDCVRYSSTKNENVSKHILTQKYPSKLKTITPSICTNLNIGNQIGIISFNIKDMHHETVAKALAYESGIAVRSGCFCAHPYVQLLLQVTSNQRKQLLKHPDSQKPGMLRISFGMYNTFEEIDLLVNSIKAIVANKAYFTQKYQ